MFLSYSFVVPLYPEYTFTMEFAALHGTLFHFQILIYDAVILCI